MSYDENFLVMSSGAFHDAARVHSAIGGLGAQEAARPANLLHSASCVFISAKREQKVQQVLH